MACRSWGPTELFRGGHPRRSWKTRMPSEGVESRRSPETLWPMPMRRSKSHRRRPHAGISTLFTAFALPIPADTVPIEGRSSEYPEEWNQDEGLWHTTTWVGISYKTPISMQFWKKEKEGKTERRVLCVGGCDCPPSVFHVVVPLSQVGQMFFGIQPSKALSVCFVSTAPLRFARRVLLTRLRTPPARCSRGTGSCEVFLDGHAPMDGFLVSAAGVSPGSRTPPCAVFGWCWCL